MFVLYSTVKTKGKMQDNQDAETSTDKVQRQNKGIKKSRRKHDCLSLVSAVYCQLEVSATC